MLAYPRIYMICYLTLFHYDLHEMCSSLNLYKSDICERMVVVGVLGGRCNNLHKMEVDTDSYYYDGSYWFWVESIIWEFVLICIDLY